MLKILFAATLCAASLFGKIEESRANDFLMTDDHPEKTALDAFFMQRFDEKKRATFSEKTLKQAGFKSFTPREFSRVVVTKHPNFPSLYFKLYLDVQRYHKGHTEKEFWAWRCEGADRIRKEITENHWEDTFKVPQKWVYTLPKYPRPPKGYIPKNTILVQEDMDLLSEEENLKAWGSSLITFETLDRLYYILKKHGLNDCSKIPNIPIAKDGRIAFIDTQGIDVKDIPYEDLDRFLNEANKSYWKKITRSKINK